MKEGDLIQVRESIFGIKEIDGSYFMVALMGRDEGSIYESDYIFRAWGNEARMTIQDSNGSAPFIHYFSPRIYALAVNDFVDLCLQHFGKDWLERGG